MQPVDSKQEKLNMTGILSIVNQASDSGIDLRKFALQTVALCSRPDTRNMTFGNTLFIVADAGDRLANFIVYNADTPENFIQNYTKAMDAAYMLGFDEMFTQFNEQFLPFYKVFLDGLDNDDYGYEIIDLGNGKYQAQARLGTPRDGE